MIDLTFMTKMGAYAVDFGTCLYVAAAAFIIEFQGYSLVWWDL